MAIVLIVENDDYQRELYEQELRDEGYEVWLAADAPPCGRLVVQRREVSRSTAATTSPREWRGKR